MVEVRLKLFEETSIYLVAAIIDYIERQNTDESSVRADLRFIGDVLNAEADRRGYRFCMIDEEVE